MPIRAASSTGSPSTISAAAAVAGARRPAALGVEADGGDPAVLDRSEIRDEIAAGGAPGGAGEGAVGSGAAAALVAQVVLEELACPYAKGRVHAAERPSRPIRRTQMRLQPAGTASGFDPLK